MLRAFLFLSLLASMSAPADASQSAPPQPAPGLAQPPRGDLQGIVTADDYPVEAIDNGEEGSVTVLLTVNERGQVSGCEVETSSGSPSLDAQTCAIASRRAKFEPARDSSGRPAIGGFRQRVTWKLEDSVEPPPAATSPELSRIAAELPKAAKAAVLLNSREVARAMDYPEDALREEMQGQTHVRLLVDRAGQVTGCWLVKSSGHDLLDAQTCDLYVANGKFRPARNRRGHPVASLSDQRLHWRLESGPVRIAANLATRVTAVLGPEGQLRSCKGEEFVERSWREGPPAMCDEMRDSDPQFRRAMREKSKLHDAVVVIETRALMDAAQAMPNVGRRSGEVLVALRSATLSYGPDGKRIGCVTVESIGFEGRNDLCSTPHHRFPQPPPELIGKATLDPRFLTAIYLLGEPQQ